MAGRGFLHRLILTLVVTVLGPTGIALVISIVMGVAMLIVLQVEPSQQTKSADSNLEQQSMEQPQPGKGAKAIPQDLIPVYQDAVKQFGGKIPWTVVAGIHSRETNFGRTTTDRDQMVSSASALGPMQFLPSTFEQYGVDGDGDGRRDIWNERDAIYSAANMLTQRYEANLKNPKRRNNALWWAIWDYNHATWYVEDVLNNAESFAAQEQSTPVANSEGWVSPLAEKAPITSEFGMRNHPVDRQVKQHNGVDVGIAEGTPVHAAQKGLVTRAGWAGGYGYMVEIDHGSGVTTRYAHLSEINVQIGQQVEKGEQVAQSGNTGKSTGAHLHFEVRKHGVPQNPVAYLK